MHMVVLVLFKEWPEKPQVNQNFTTQAFLQETKISEEKNGVQNA